MSVSYVSQGETRQVAPPDHIGKRTRNYQPVDNSGTEQHALEENALVLNISLTYYSDPNAKRLPRYWLPTRARW